MKKKHLALIGLGIILLVLLVVVVVNIPREDRIPRLLDRSEIVRYYDYPFCPVPGIKMPNIWEPAFDAVAFCYFPRGEDEIFIVTRFKGNSCERTYYHSKGRFSDQGELDIWVERLRQLLQRFEEKDLPPGSRSV